MPVTTQGHRPLTEEERTVFLQLLLRLKETSEDRMMIRVTHSLFNLLVQDTYTQKLPVDRTTPATNPERIT